MSVPMVASISPSTVVSSALSVPPSAAKAATAVSPRTISAKYSGAWKVSAQAARLGAASISSSVATVPPTKEPQAQSASALPARPLRAIG